MFSLDIRGYCGRAVSHGRRGGDDVVRGAFLVKRQALIVADVWRIVV